MASSSRAQALGHPSPVEQAPALRRQPHREQVRVGEAAAVVGDLLGLVEARSNGRRRRCAGTSGRTSTYPRSTTSSSTSSNSRCARATQPPPTADLPTVHQHQRQPERRADGGQLRRRRRGATGRPAAAPGCSRCAGRRGRRRWRGRRSRRPVSASSPVSESPSYAASQSRRSKASRARSRSSTTPIEASPRRRA